jgi:hypothetical protein
MNNYSDASFDCPDCVCPSSFTDLGVFISGVLLSIGGVIAIIGSQCRASKCNEITCSKCLKIKREGVLNGV